MLKRVHKFLTASTTKTFNSQIIFWLSLSLTFSIIYSFLGWREASSSEYVVQDDARQHVFWMLRFLDPELFPQDLIANYFQSVAPPGYTGVYQIFAAFGINPLVLNKLLPSVLGLLTTSFCFGVCLQMFPLPAAAFSATLLLNQLIWMKDDVVSATPRGFAYPLFLAFLYYLLRASWLGVAVAIALLGLFYPHYVLVSAVILIIRLCDWNKRLLSPNHRDYLLCATGLVTALLVLLPFALKSSEYGPAITAAAAKQLPEFLPGGRTEFFHLNPWKFWVNGQRSGILPRYLFTPATVYIGLFLPLLLRFPAQFPLVRQVTSKAKLLLQIALASVVMFFVAHALLFKLHIPSRYTGMSLRTIMALAAGITLLIILDGIFHWVQQQAKPQLLRQILALGALTLLCATLIFYPSFVEGFPFAKYKIGEVPELYQFFQKQPKNIAIASLAEEANNIPTFSQRSILVGREYAIPYQVGYYNQFRQRTLDLIRAQYNTDLVQLQNFIRQYKVDFWLLDRAAFTPDYIANNEWIIQYQPQATEALIKLQQGTTPALARLMQRCQVFETEGLVVLQAKCINNQK